MSPSRRDEVRSRALVLRRAVGKAHELDARLAELHLAAVEQRDVLLPLVAVVGVGAVRAAGVLDRPGARLPAQDGVRAGDGRLRHDDVLIGAAADRDQRLVEREHHARRVRRVRRVGDEQRLRAGRERLARAAPERRARVEALARDLHLARRERGRVEEAQVPRLRAQRGSSLRQRKICLISSTRQRRRHVEHDLRAHRLRARPVAGLGHAAGPHLPEREAERVDVVLGARAARAQALGRHVVRRAAVRRRAGTPRAQARALLREAEVEDDGAIARHHDVAGLEIAVDEALRVDRGEARRRLRSRSCETRRPCSRPGPCADGCACAASARRCAPSRGSAPTGSARDRGRGRRSG